MGGGVLAYDFDGCICSKWTGPRTTTLTTTRTIVVNQMDYVTLDQGVLLDRGALDVQRF